MPSGVFLKNGIHLPIDGFIPPLRIRERYGLARDRFLNWDRYLKIWPGGEPVHTWDYIQPFVDAFNSYRRKR